MSEAEISFLSQPESVFFPASRKILSIIFRLIKNSDDEGNKKINIKDLEIVETIGRVPKGIDYLQQVLKLDKKGDEMVVIDVSKDFLKTSFTKMQKLIQSREDFRISKGVVPANISLDQWWVHGLEPELQSNKLIDRILGCIYGNALGDAYGLATEFMDKKEVKSTYHNENIPFPYFVRNHHNIRWDAGDWTDDTDQMILIMDTILETGKADKNLFAKKLAYWIDHGFPELGDRAGMGLGRTVASVVEHPKFLDDPHFASEYIWRKGKCQIAPNGAVMRNAILGIFDYKDLEKVKANTERICKVTHFDTRCVASCFVSSLAIALMLQGHDVDTFQGLESLIEQVIKEATAVLDKEHHSEFMQYMTAEKPADMALDDSKTIGYTFKCIGSGMFGLRSSKNFKETLLELIREGGDADTNGAVCGSLLGCKIGFSKLPKDWLIELPNKRWFDRKVAKFIKTYILK